MTGVSHVLHHHRCFEGGSGIGPEGKYAMMPEQDRGRLRAMLQNDLSDVTTHVIHVGSAWNLSSEFVRRSGQRGDDRPLEQGETGGVVRVRVYDSADLGTMGIQIEVVRQINTRIQIITWVPSLQPMSVQVRDHEKRRRQFIVIHSAGLDHDASSLAVDAAGISAVHRDQPGTKNAQIGLENLFPQSS